MSWCDAEVLEDQVNLFGDVSLDKDCDKRNQCM